MRPTTSTSTNNSKTSGKSQILKTPFVSFPFQRSKFNSTIFVVARRFRGLTHSRYNFKWDRERRVKCYSEILVLEKTSLQICYREGKNWLIVISTMATNGAEFMSNYGRSVLIPIYEIMNGREEADLLIGNGKRIYETQVTKSRNAPLLIEVARRYKGGSVNLRLRTRWPETEKLYDTLQLKLLEGRYANS